MISILINPLALINSHAGETFGSRSTGRSFDAGVIEREWKTMEFDAFRESGKRREMLFVRSAAK